MDANKELIKLLKEANIYQTQGLLADARRKYEDAAAILQAQTEFKNREELIARVERKIAFLEKDVYRVERRRVTPEISLTDNELIKKLFSVSASHDPDDAAIEGAMALAKFGLFERAIQEFELLMENPARRMEVAKHILRCRAAIRAAHDPMVQLKKWADSSFFSDKELDRIRVFLERAYGVISPPICANVVSEPPALPAAGKVAPTPSPSQPSAPLGAYDPYEDSYEDVLDMLPKAAAKSGATGSPPSESYDELIDQLIPDKKAKKKVPEEEPVEEYIDYLSSVSIPVTIGPRKGQLIDIPVNLQTADTVNVIIPAAHKDLIAMLRKGVKVEKVKLNSPISIGTGNGLVLAAALIDQGPRQGDYSVDFRFDN